MIYPYFIRPLFLNLSVMTSEVLDRREGKKIKYISTKVVFKEGNHFVSLYIYI